MFKYLLFFVCAFNSTYAQTDTLSLELRQALDSMLKNDEFIKLMNEKPGSYVDVSVGLSNGIFSLKNNSLNAGQAETKKIYYTPSVSYFHKSGFAISFNGYIAGDKGQVKMYQYAISPSYTYDDKNVTAGLSYTRFIKGSTASFDISPFTNDFYANVFIKKTWIQPGLAIGYSYGKQVELFDTSFWFTPQPPFQPIPRIVHIRDTITTKLSGLTFSLSASHTWDFYKLLNKKDALQIQPSILLNAGSQKWDIKHSSKLADRRPSVQNYLKDRFGNGEISEKFNLQSLGLLTQVTYYFGKFYFQPQLYFDYYLPETSEKRITSLFSVLTGFYF